ncbi:MAG TPA: MarR family transcriptional regulator [Candidatus Sulfotelmatobacter sp.]|nr:MarR family transcriptional regulator [Candidatus Sulfotelmatobacter sp.]
MSRRVNGDRAEGAAADPIDLRELRSCTAARLRRAARRVSQLYDDALEPAGVTIAQFGLLAQLEGSLAQSTTGIALGELAERMTTDPTTLTRNLRPLEARGLLRTAPDTQDRRVRRIRITPTGRAALRAAIPLWRRAQAQVEGALGSGDVGTLRALLERTAAASF